MLTGDAGITKVRRELARKVLAVLAPWGYEEQTLPAWLDYEGLRPALHNFAGESCKFIGPEGDVRLLLPDATLGVLTLWREGAWPPGVPLRVAYETEVYRAVDGPWRRLRQVGAELLYVNGALGDGEVLATALQALQVVPRLEATVVVNDVGIARSLIELAAAEGDGADDSFASRMMAALARGDFVSLQNLLADRLASPLAAQVWRWLTLRGSLDEVRAGLADLPAGATARTINAALDHLEIVIQLAGGPQPFVDLGLLRDLGYYDSFVFQVVASSGNGENIVAGGGRYDGLFGAFDTPVPAAGFALDLDLLSQVYRGSSPAAPDHTLTVAPSDLSALQAAWQKARRLREEGFTVILNTEGTDQRYEGEMPHAGR